MRNNTILTITGSDSTGESGVQADIRTISALGGVALSVITSITVQNTLGIQEFYDLPAETVSGQLDAIINDMEPGVVKIGMIRSCAVLGVVVKALRKYRPEAVIYDPILFSTRGERLMAPDVIEQIRRQLFPLCTLIVVSRREGNLMLSDYVSDNVCFLEDSSCHGTANSFSSALAVYMSQGCQAKEAIAKARDYISQLTGTTSVLQGRSSRLYNEFIALAARDFVHNSDVAYYADHLNVSPRYLAQVCRRIAGKSPKNIIDSYLLHGIESALTTTGESIQEIAQEYGFSSQAHLSKFFKKQTGLSPSKWRTMRVKNEE